MAAYRVEFALLALSGLTLAQSLDTGSLLRDAEKLIAGERFPQAETVLIRVVKENPANAEAVYRLGYAQFRQRKLAEARVNFTKVHRLAPPAYYSRYFLGRIALMENKPKEAVSWLDPVVNSNEPVFDAAAQLSQAHASSGDPRKAITPLRRAIADAPWESSLYYRLGRLYQQTSQAELARDAFATSTRLKSASSQDVELLMTVSQNLREGKIPQALETGAKIVGRTDANPDALVALGVLYGNGNLTEAAIHAFRRATETDPRQFQAQFNYGLSLLKGGKAEDAMDPLRKAVALLPQSTDAQLTFGLAAVMNKLYADAVPALEQVLPGDASNPRIVALLATAYLRTSAPGKAIPLLRAVVAREAVDPAAHLLLIEALNANHDQEAALDAAQRARARYPESAQIQMAAAQQLARLGRYQDALPLFAEVLRLDSQHGEAELGLADCLQRGGDYSTAISHYRNVLDRPGTGLAARLGLSRSLVALKLLDESRQVLEDGIGLYPADPAVRQELSRVYARLGKPELASEQAKIAEQLKSGSR